MDEDAEDLGWCLKPNRHLLDPEVCGEAAVCAKRQVKLVEVLPRHEGRVELHGQLVKLSIQTVLHDIALSAARE